MELSINPNTIQRAYTELERRGVVYAVKGKGNFVADMQAARSLREKEVKEEAEHLVRKAKEAGMAKETLHGLLDVLWQENKMAQKDNGASEPENAAKQGTMQQTVSEQGVGGEADD